VADEDAKKKPAKSEASSSRSDTAAPSAAGASQPPAKAPAGASAQPTPAGEGAHQPPVVEYVVTCHAATGSVQKVERFDAEGRRTELTPAEYHALAQLYAAGGTAVAPLYAAMAADPFGLCGTPTPAALSSVYWQAQGSPEAQAYYLGYAAGCAQLASFNVET